MFGDTAGWAQAVSLTTPTHQSRDHTPSQQVLFTAELQRQKNELTVSRGGGEGEGGRGVKRKREREGKREEESERKGKRKRVRGSVT